jgi:hypothetical protein
MDEWNLFITTVNKEIKRLERDGCVLPFFRGHNNSKWPLFPLIYRNNPKFEAITAYDNTTFAEFHANCGQLYSNKLTDWEILCEMRHSGIPTRLLDWTENFAVALYFALNGVDWKKNNEEKDKIAPCVWIMDPYDLNDRNFGEGTIQSFFSLPFAYSDILEMNTAKFGDKMKGPIALIPSRDQKRIFAQRCAYTLHALDYGPLEKNSEKSVKKIEIPLSAIGDAEDFLFLCGMNDYSLFPDLDGLGSYIRKKHCKLL